MLAVGAKRARPADLHEALGVGERQRAEHQRADDAEDRGRGADPEREGDHRGCREGFADAERPDRVSDVVAQVVEPSPAPDVARFLAQAQGAAEALRVGHHRAMRLDLLTQLVVVTVPVDEVPEAPDPFSDGVHGLMI